MNEQIERSAVAGSFTLQAQLPDGQSLSFSGYVIQGDTIDDINTKMDLARQSVARQRLMAELPELEKSLEVKRDALEQYTHIIEDLGKNQVSTKARAELTNAMNNKKGIQRQIEKGEEAIDRAKKLVAEATAA